MVVLRSVAMAPTPGTSPASVARFRAVSILDLRDDVSVAMTILPGSRCWWFVIPEVAKQPSGTQGRARPWLGPGYSLREFRDDNASIRLGLGGWGLAAHLVDGVGGRNGQQAHVVEDRAHLEAGLEALERRGGPVGVHAGDQAFLARGLDDGVDCGQHLLVAGVEGGWLAEAQGQVGGSDVD